VPQSNLSPPEETYVLDDALWERLLELTDGAATACFQCGVCTAICPWGIVKGETVSIRSFIRQAQLGLITGNDNLWLCTSCSQCEAYCPRGVKITQVLRGLRSLAWEQRDTPSGLPSLLWSVYWNNNPWTQPPSQRTLWAKDIDLPAFDAEQHEILFYVGCTPSYDGRASKVAQSLVRLFQAAGVSFGVLGEDEPCCGESVLSVGHLPYFEEVSAHTTEIFSEHGVKKIVTVSPHCYDVFKNHYPAMGDDFVPLHYTQYLAELINSERLRFERSVEQTVTFHDPCYLSRHNNESAAPRQILSALPGINVQEMEHSDRDTLCCGGGGGRMWLETEPGERFSDIRVQEAQATGAHIMITACPFCIACLEDSLKAQQISDLVVMDIAEIAQLGIAP
jgi:Fe-S oxidoreductase